MILGGDAGDSQSKWATMSNSSNENFSKFFASTVLSLRIYVSRLLGSKTAAEDVVQEAYLKLYQQRSSLENPKAFLFVTARNLASNVQRHLRISATDSVADMSVFSAHADGRGSIEDCLIADEELRLLAEAVESLSPQCRAAFSLKLFQGLSYKQIAVELGISVKTVEKHISKGLRETHAYLSCRYWLPEAGGARNE